MGLKRQRRVCDKGRLGGGGNSVSSSGISNPSDVSLSVSLVYEHIALTGEISKVTARELQL